MSADTPDVLTEQERTYGRVDPTMQTRGRWYSEASVEKIVAARVAAERERADAAEAKIAAVEVVLGRWNPPDDVQHMLLRDLSEQIRAALGGEATP